MHPEVAKHLEGGTCVSYGARTLNEGGYHSIPKLTFPGGLLVGCSAGFLNSVKIKGTHTAIKSGMVAAESLHESLSANEQFAIANTEDCEIDPAEPVFEATSYATAMESSWAVAELKEVRNCHASFHFGFLPGLAYSGLSAHLLRGREPWTWKAGRPDAEKTQESADFSPIDYPPPDGVLSFDLLTNLQRSGVYHEDDQPSHLRVKEESAHVPVEESLRKYAGPEQRFCPAGVYEYVPDEEEQEDRGDDEAHALIEGKKKLVINAQNCVHCKCCSIKMPQEYIKWTVPEGGGGPQYPIM